MYVGTEAYSKLEIHENYEEIIVRVTCRGTVHYDENICFWPFKFISDSIEKLGESFGHVIYFKRSGDPHILALNDKREQPKIARNEYFRSGSLLNISNVSSSIICTIEQGE